jgi:DNA-binding XRE family transcriptional regulator
MIGYSVELTRANSAANARNLGVKLGRVCISKKYPVSKAAKACGVSRATIYSWFKGEVHPKASYEHPILALIQALK